MVSRQRDVPISCEFQRRRQCLRRANSNSDRRIMRLRHWMPRPYQGKLMEANQKRASAPKSLQVAAAVIGNALEWYDFVIFGFLTVVISRLFSPPIVNMPRYC